MKKIFAICVLGTMLSLLAQAFAAAKVDYAQRADVKTFVEAMQTQHGFDPRELSRWFAQTQPIPGVIKAIRPPKNPGIRSWQTYRARFVEPIRIAAGRRFMREYAKDLDEAETRYGVPAEIIAAIIGVETIYGRNMGSFNTFAALTTLAFDYPPRAPLFRKELEELLLLARDEQRSPLDYVGSYAGALGLPQFLPSSRRRFAVDFDQDGRIDLIESRQDAIGSVANFLAQHGWRKGEPIAVRVLAGGDGLQTLIDEGIAPRMTPEAMLALGVDLQKVGAGATDREIPNQPAALIDFVTPRAATEYRLGYQNFWVITRYNRSSFYAASVMDLAEALR